LKQELIEARAHKSASDDQLGNVSGKLETLENTITSLYDEGSHFNDVTIIQPGVNFTDIFERLFCG